MQALHQEGHEISVDLSLYAVQGRGGWHAIGILRDTTARKRAEEALRETNRELELATLHANEMAVQAELAETITQAFLSDMPVQIERLAAAAAADDARQSEQQAHRIKGAAANMGAAALEQAALAVEQAGKAGDVLTLRGLMPQVPRQFEILRAVLEEARVEPTQP